MTEILFSGGLSL